MSKQHLKCPACWVLIDFGSAQRKHVRCLCGALLFGEEFKLRGGFATMCEEGKAKVVKR